MEWGRANPSLNPNLDISRRLRWRRGLGQQVMQHFQCFYLLSFFFPLRSGSYARSSAWPQRCWVGSQHAAHPK